MKGIAMIRDMSNDCLNCGHSEHSCVGPCLHVVGWFPVLGDLYCQCKRLVRGPTLAQQLEALRVACGCRRCVGDRGHTRTCALGGNGP